MKNVGLKKDGVLLICRLYPAKENSVEVSFIIPRCSKERCRHQPAQLSNSTLCLQHTSPHSPLALSSPAGLTHKHLAPTTKAAVISIYIAHPPALSFDERYPEPRYRTSFPIELTKPSAERILIPNPFFIYPTTPWLAISSPPWRPREPLQPKTALNQSFTS